MTATDFLFIVSAFNVFITVEDVKRGNITKMLLKYIAYTSFKLNLKNKNNAFNKICFYDRRDD